MNLMTLLFGTGMTYPVNRVKEKLPPQEQTAHDKYRAYQYVVDANAQRGNHTIFEAEVKLRTPREDLPEMFVKVGTFDTAQKAVEAIKNYRNVRALDFNYYGTLVGRVKAR
jgi:hypothetical protein